MSNRLLVTLLPEEYFEEGILINKCKLLVDSSFITSLFSCFYFLISLAIDFSAGIYVMLSLTIITLFIPYLLRKGLPLLPGSYLLIISGFMTLAIIIIYSGGLYSAVLPWLIVIPITSFLFLNRTSAIVALFVLILFVVILGFMQVIGYDFEPNYNTQWRNEFIVASMIGLFFIVFLLSRVFENSIYRTFLKLSNKSREAEEQRLKVKKSNYLLKQKNADLVSAQQDLELAHYELKIVNNNLEKLVNERTRKIININENLVNVNKELDLFIYRASHDLRGPLASLLGIVRIGKNEVSDKRGLEYLEIIEQSSLNLDRVLKKLITVNGIKNKHISDIKHIDFDMLFNDLTMSFQEEFSKINIYLTKNISIKGCFQSNIDLLKIIFYNLIENSIIFRKQEISDVFINITIEKDENSLLITYTDYGIGIPAKISPYIYDMFYRGSRLSQGNGLGLYIIKKALEKLNGNISHKSEQNSYTTFHISIPTVSQTYINDNEYPEKI